MEPDGTADSPGDAGTPALSLPRSPESVSAARRFVADHCQQWQLRGSYDGLLLLVSETVTNAVQHARSRLVEVRLVRHPPAVWVEVRDDDATPPAPRAAGGDAESGRGMELVDALSDEWGVTANSDGSKTVWFDVTPEPE